MGEYNIFTWNMVRSNCLKSDQRNSDDLTFLRFELLQELCQEHHFGFVTEAGPDLYDTVSKAEGKSIDEIEALCLRDAIFRQRYQILTELSGPDGRWLKTGVLEDQDIQSGCHNLIFSKFEIDPVKLNFVSGKTGATRSPAAGLCELPNGPQLLLIAFHATSGGGGYQNCHELENDLDPQSEGDFTSKRICDIAVIGGDLNATIRSRGYFQPDAPTHQDGHTYDGFFKDVYDGETDVMIGNAAIYTGNGHYELVTTDQTQIGRPAGYLRLRQPTGRSRRSQYAAVKTGNSLSDHAAVTATLIIEASRGDGSESDTRSGMCED